MSFHLDDDRLAAHADLGDFCEQTMKLACMIGNGNKNGGTSHWLATMLARNGTRARNALGEDRTHQIRIVQSSTQVDQLRLHIVE